MSQKGFLSWVGYKDESGDIQISTTTPSSGANAAPANKSTSTPSAAPSSHVLDRIRELESELADLRSRKDLTSLSREELEILATETAVTLIKTAQQRERAASVQAAKILSDSSRVALDATATAEAKAKSIMDSAESRARKYIATVESEGASIKATAEKAAKAFTDAAKREADAIRSSTQQEIEAALAAKRREASALTSTAKREAEALIAEAAANVVGYRDWLNAAVAESERLYKVQAQSLASAQQAIEQSRNRLTSAFEKLALLTQEVEQELSADDFPQIRNVEGIPTVESPKRRTSKSTPKRAAKKSSAR